MSPLRYAIEKRNVSGVRELLRSNRLSSAHILDMSDLASNIWKGYKEQVWRTDGKERTRQVAEIFEILQVASHDIQASESRSFSIPSDHPGNDTHGDVHEAAFPGVGEDAA